MGRLTLLTCRHPDAQKVMPERPIRQPHCGQQGSRRVVGYLHRRALSYLGSDP